MAEEKATLQDLKDITEAAGVAAPVVDAAAAVAADVEVDQNAPMVRVAIIDAQGRSYATGKRKDAVARVWIKRGSGKVT